MKALIQRVSEASVSIDGRCVGRIGPGILALVGIGPDDGEAQAEKLLGKLLGHRIFPDAQGKMNLSLRDTVGGLLLVPNFTLMADTRKGTRPSFAPAAPPEQARSLFERLCRQAEAECAEFSHGVFGADMQVSLCNDGPVTLLLEVS